MMFVCLWCDAFLSSSKELLDFIQKSVYKLIKSRLNVKNVW